LLRIYLFVFLLFICFHCASSSSSSVSWAALGCAIIFLFSLPDLL
jgi:hypothetical protein